MNQFLGSEYQGVQSADYPTFIPKPYLEKIINSGEGSPLWRQFIPCETEDCEDGQSKGLSDPIGDKIHSKENGIIHRYHNRILFTPTEVCPILCRYCFRKNELLQGETIFKGRLEALTEYLISHPHVEEVILTGGDPFILSTDKIEQILKTLSGIKTVKMVRFHSRTPVILPNRFNSRLISVLQHYSRHFTILTLVIHTNHVSEWTPEFLYILNSLHKAGVTLLSQSVLLKNVNDNWEDLKLLFQGLLSHGVTPYYLHHPDKVKGAMHFYLSIEEGQRIFNQLRRFSSGIIIPHYVVETPDGGGKEPVTKFIK